MTTFVHISDIHFGQEKYNGEVIVNNDIKQRLIDDAARVLHFRKKYPATGILVTGDIAYAGKNEQYADAGKWLDQLAVAIGCPKTSVHLVPGNHDVDHSEISHSVKWMLQEIADNGEKSLDRFLSNATDSKTLHRRFSSYVPFAEAYNCPLDSEGGLAGDKPVELAKGRTLRFIGLNTALACSTKDDEGRLVLGAKQRVLPIRLGEELVILAHHPLNWFQDRLDALNFIKNRARLLITGHEHKPDIIRKDNLLFLAAGATSPPSSEQVEYTYNIIEFDLDAATDQLLVTVHPRKWEDADKDFPHDLSNIKDNQTFTLDCPNFKGATPGTEGAVNAESPELNVAEPLLVVEDEAGASVDKMSDEFALVLLRFFRDLSPSQRVRVLVNLGALPNDWSEELSHGMERQVVDNLQSDGKLCQLSAAIDLVLAKDNVGEN